MISPDYQIVERISPAHVRVRFAGAFEQPEVNWQADIMSLENYRFSHAGFAPEHGERTALMVAGDLDADPRRILVALPFAEITRREIMQTVVMLRNYRRMREGLRQWSG
ncbi:MAG: hypothetical protein DSZ32_03965 [Gammaproteobacteria bacterium]|nr:MAG: hypothetical protein DSZ32_03965 [Gammaproteobacteria bacterium]